MKAAKSEQEAQRLQLRSLQYLERYIYLVLFNAYLHLEKADSWQRPFSTWMREVRGGRPRLPAQAPVERKAFSSLIFLFGWDFLLLTLGPQHSVCAWQAVAA